MKFILIVLFICVLKVFGSCNNNKPIEIVKTDTSINVTNSFNTLFLDSVQLSAFLKEHIFLKKFSNQFFDFYKSRNYQYAWFNKEGMTSAVSNFQNLLQNYHDNYLDKSLINNSIAILISKIQNDKSESKINESRITELELLLSTTFFKYSKKVFTGIYQNPNNLDWYIPRNKKNYQMLLDSLVVSKKGNHSWEPSNKYYIALKQKLIKYREIEKRGGFPKIILPKKLLSITDK